MIPSELLFVLACPVCRGDLNTQQERLICRACSQEYPVIDGFPVLIPNIEQSDIQLSLDKWNVLYRDYVQKDSAFIEYLKTAYVFPDGNYLRELPDLPGGKFLEIGCGGGISGKVMQDKGYVSYGLDFSLDGLRLSRKVNESFGVQGYLVCGEICHPPFKENVFDVVYGGGVIEHLENTKEAVNALFTITREGGYCVNSVPVVSLSSMTYRQLSGNIPDIPVLKQIFLFVHTRILKTRFMHTGYEKSFLMTTLRRIHRFAGFRDVTIMHYEYDPYFPHFPEWFKPFLRWLEKFRLFWMGVHVRARK